MRLIGPISLMSSRAGSEPLICGRRKPPIFISGRLKVELPSGFFFTTSGLLSPAGAAEEYQFEVLFCSKSFLTFRNEQLGGLGVCMP
jgi:hypothetical protein